MAKLKVIVKKLHSVEAVGSVSVICSKKTGTVTRNEQTVTELHTVDELVVVNPAAPALPAHVSPAPHNTTKSELYATTRALSEPEVSPMTPHSSLDSRHTTGVSSSVASGPNCILSSTCARE